MRRVIQLIVFVLILWYGHSTFEKFKQNSLFTVRKINIDVKNDLLVKDLYNSIKEIEGKNILRINEKQIKQKILEDVRIKDVTIEKKMPDTINFIIKEKNPFAYIEYNDDIFISDKDGVIYGYMNESRDYNMPLFRVKDKEEIKDFIKIITKIPYSDEVSQIYSINNGVVITVNNGLKIIANLSVDENKYKVAEKLYNQVKLELDRRHKIEHIDLRFNDYIVKKIEGDKR